MIQSDDIDRSEIRQLVYTLFQSENKPGNRDAAASILAKDYLPIVRAKGQVDRSREETLNKIANASTSFYRDVDRASIEVELFQDNIVAIARTLLSTIDSSQDPPITAFYRNMQVFLKRNNQWQCIAWQVTKVQ